MTIGMMMKVMANDNDDEDGAESGGSDRDRSC